jgi:hypothetical protein
MCPGQRAMIRLGLAVGGAGRVEEPAPVQPELQQVPAHGAHRDGDAFEGQLGGVPCGRSTSVPGAVARSGPPLQPGWRWAGGGLAVRDAGPVKQTGLSDRVDAEEVVEPAHQKAVLDQHAAVHLHVFAATDPRQHHDQSVSAHDPARGAAPPRAASVDMVVLMPVDIRRIPPVDGNCGTKPSVTLPSEDLFSRKVHNSVRTCSPQPTTRRRH